MKIKVDSQLKPTLTVIENYWNTKKICIVKRKRKISSKIDILKIENYNNNNQ